MPSIVPIVGFALIATIVLALLRPLRPELAVLLGLVAGALILLAVIPRIAQIVGLLEDMARRGGVGADYLAALLKIVGIAYLTEFGAQAARDAGEGALASKVELAGKILILVIAIPLVIAVLDLILRLIGQGAG
jgi:stage III sporulation protein AD